MGSYMNTIDYIKMSLELSKNFALKLVADMRDAPLTAPTVKGGNHPLWVLGHLVYSESGLLDRFILGQPNRFPELEHCRGGTTPSIQLSDYPSMDEMFAKFELIRAATLAHLDTLCEADLDKKSHAPEVRGPSFATVAGCFAIMSMHPAIHAGQVTDSRRSAGREPLLV